MNDFGNGHQRTALALMAIAKYLYLARRRAIGSIICLRSGVKRFRSPLLERRVTTTVDVEKTTGAAHIEKILVN